MFKKAKMFSKVKDKAFQVKDAGIREASKFRDSESVSDATKHIQNVAKQVFQKIGSEASDALDNDEKFLKVVDTAYDTLPFQVKIFLRRKRFQKIMLKMRKKYRKKKEMLPDDSSMEIIKETMVEDD